MAAWLDINNNASTNFEADAEYNPIPGGPRRR
jgi:hypothetical protein